MYARTVLYQYTNITAHYSSRSLGEDLLLSLVGRPGQRQHLPVDVDGRQVGDANGSHGRWARIGELVGHLRVEERCPSSPQDPAADLLLAEVELVVRCHADRLQAAALSGRVIHGEMVLNCITLCTLTRLHMLLA